MAGSLRGLLALPAIANGVRIRQRTISVPGGGTFDFTLGSSELADYVLLFGFRGAGIGGKISYQLVQPSVPGSYDVVTDDEEVVLGFAKGTPPTIRFTNTAAGALNVQVQMALFSQSQLEDLRCYLNLQTVPLPAGAVV